MEGATPFFGAKISLISKSEIRYEGVLYTIDPKESTIALAKVRSFGTENRQADRPVPPRDEIFEFIIFRASDIKDLVVDDAPGQTPAQQAEPAFEDPAIVKSTPPAVAKSTPPAIVKSTPAGGAGPSSISVAVASSSQAQAVEREKGTARRVDWNAERSLNRETFGVSSARPAHQRFSNNNNNNNRSGGGGDRFHNGGGYGQGYNNRGRGDGQRYNNNNRMGDGQRSFGRGGMRGMGGGRGGHYQSRNAGPIKFAPLPDGEFDFEKAHSDFQMLEEKLKSLKLNGGAAPGEESSSSDLPPIAGIPASAITVAALEEEISSEPCYNKSTSFFDNISCEAVEREKGTVKRVDWKAERSLNKETFGVSSARPAHQRFFNNNRNGGGRFHNGGGYGEGYNNRGRGGYNNRGRGGYNNNNNRDRMGGNRDRVPAADQVGA